MNETTKVELEQKLNEAAITYNRIHDERIALLRQAYELDRSENEAYATWWAMREALTHLGYNGEPQHLLRVDEVRESYSNDEDERLLLHHALRIVSDIVGSAATSPFPKWELRKKSDRF